MLKRIISPLCETKLLLVLSLLCVLGVGEIEGQVTNVRSPYSGFGYGMHAPRATSGARAMGGIGIGLRDGLITNPSNPASYTAVDSLTFLMDVGASFRLALLQEGEHSDRRLLGNLEYLTMLFPLGKRAAFSAGLMPYTTTGYSFGSVAKLDGDTNERNALRTYQGTGTYNDLYVGLAYKPLRGFSLGVNASYLFGHNTHTRQVTYYTVGALNSLYSEELSLKGLKFDVGAQYELRLDTLKEHSRSVVLGATMMPEVRLSTTRTWYHRQLSGTGSGEIMGADTIVGREHTLPLSLGAGLSYRVADKLLLGADVQYSKWADAKFDQSKALFQDQWQVAIGGEWIPNYRSRGLFGRTRYRFGVQCSNSYLQVPVGVGVYGGYNQYALTAGVGVPLIDRRSMLNIGVDYKYLNPKVAGMVQEHYLGVNIGISFNEGWFRKARVH